MHGCSNNILGNMVVCLKGDPFSTVGRRRESLYVSWMGGRHVLQLYVVLRRIIVLLGKKKGRHLSIIERKFYTTVNN